MKNKKSLKNLKQYSKNRVRFWFYIIFRPWLVEGTEKGFGSKKVKQMFFPVMALVLIIGILKYESEKEWVFENPKVAVVFEESKSHGSPEGSPAGYDGDGTLAKNQQGADTSSVTNPSPVRGSAQVDKLLKAICTVESQCDTHRVGDNGQSYGAFQIHLPSHPTITKEQAMNFAWAEDWTLNHCKQYLNDPYTFALCHNGIGKYPRNSWYADRVMQVYKSL